MVHFVVEATRVIDARSRSMAGSRVGKLSPSRAAMYCSDSSANTAPPLDMRAWLQCP